VGNRIVLGGGGGKEGDRRRSFGRIAGRGGGEKVSQRHGRWKEVIVLWGETRAREVRRIWQREAVG